MTAAAAKAKPLEGAARRRADSAMAVIGANNEGAEDELRAEFAEYFAAVA
jgi:beta-N-acetylhexosaminidase